MRLFAPFALLTALAAVPAPALAADLITYPTSAPETSMPVSNGGFDWNGFYAGIYGVGQFSPVNGSQYGLGLDLGVNAQFDFYLLGAEVAAHGLTGDEGETSYGQVLAKGGVLVTDDVALYATGGYGLDLGAPDQSQYLLGAGAEIAVTDNISLRAQYLHGFAGTGDNPTEQVTFGANYHF